MSRNLPSTGKLLDARSWLQAGAPAAARDHSAVDSVRTLLQLLEALPAIIPMYCYGTPEYRKSMADELGLACPRCVDRTCDACVTDEGL